ncbi:hypothetical protein Lalb_Chr13g0293431 [Lupinus albus]|uniref:Uncharacterized protein n=1 Tax=Lupinus albus TaxID=3870 RepID=A0A6A4PHS4_LUPAL|nr:hypothetical protein Lalb_Chr13g0293431 [Lupinus albus]
MVIYYSPDFPASIVTFGTRTQNFSSLWFSVGVSIVQKKLNTINVLRAIPRQFNPFFVHQGN